MKVVLISEFFCLGMGYLENMLPKYLARLGVEMHVVASDLPFFYRQEKVAKTYEGFAGHFKAGTVKTLDGFTLHILGHKKVLGHMRLRGLRQKLTSIRPDVVQTMATIGWIPLDAALLKSLLGYRLFSGSHYHASVFPLAAKPPNPFSPQWLRCLTTRTLPGWLAICATDKCYAISEDCAEVASRFFGVPRSKQEICPLGVDTELFHPVANAADRKERIDFRMELGFADGEIVCIYTGRFSADKNPLLLARAVEGIGGRYRCLFVGNGEQLEEISKCGRSVVRPFVPASALGALYRSADIGVWPAQESLSMLDAAACGLPVIANDTMSALERLEGNGLMYRLNDKEDLIKTLLSLKHPDRRAEMGACGAEKMKSQFSWESIAGRRLRDYHFAVKSAQKKEDSKYSRRLARWIF